VKTENKGNSKFWFNWNVPIGAWNAIFKTFIYFWRGRANNTRQLVTHKIELHDFAKWITSGYYLLALTGWFHHAYLIVQHLKLSRRILLILALWDIGRLMWKSDLSTAESLTFEPLKLWGLNCWSTNVSAAEVLTFEPLKLWRLNLWSSDVWTSEALAFQSLRLWRFNRWKSDLSTAEALTF
jgi:hypothetical protein